MDRLMCAISHRLADTQFSMHTTKRIELPSMETHEIYGLYAIDFSRGLCIVNGNARVTLRFSVPIYDFLCSIPYVLFNDTFKM